MSTGKLGISSAAITTADTSSTSTDRIEWSRSTILGFIEDYRRQRVLWDPNTKGYHIKQTKYEALKTLGNKYGTEIRSIRSKIKSLRSSFHREHGKVINGRRKGVQYQPMWFAYEAIRFILDSESSQQPSMESGSEETTAEEKLSSVGGEGEATAYGDEVEEDDYLRGTTGEQSQLVDDELKVEVADQLTATPTTTTKTTTTTMMMRATTSTNAYADNNNIVARVAATAVAGCSMDEFAVTCNDFDGDSQNYCNISAEDVKTEIIESDSPDPSIIQRPHTSTPSPVNYCKQTDRTYNRKRKMQTPVDRHCYDLTCQSKQQQHSNSISRQKDISQSPTTPSSFSSSKATNQADEYGVFGEYVAITIRKLKTSKSKIAVKHLINNLLYEAELGKYDHGIPSSKEPPQLYKM